MTAGPLCTATSETLSYLLYISSSGCRETCDQDWEKNGDKCYFWSTAKKNWRDAEAFCKKQGGHLASVNSNSLNNFIVEGIRKRWPEHQGWLGGTDLEEEKVWKWTDGTPWEFENWYPPNPNNGGFFKAGQHCLRYELYDRKGWDDGICSLEYRFVCSRKMCAGLQIYTII